MLFNSNTTFCFMKILVTGGCGFVGTNISLFLNKNYTVNSLDNLSKKGSKYNLNLLKKNKIKNFNVNISNFEKIKKLSKYDLIIDCCAEAAVEVSKKKIDKVIDTNLVGTINILKKAKKDNSKIIFISSSRVYPIKKPNLFSLPRIYVGTNTCEKSILNHLSGFYNLVHKFF